MLTLTHISKSFAGLHALRDVSLAVRAGEIHGLLGENGAGKSTLMNILFGLLRPDAGRITLHDRPLAISSPAAAQRAGIGMVHQHFKLVPTLSVLDNFILAAGRGLLARRRGMLARFETIAASLGWHLDPRAPVSALSVGQQQRLEIIKALSPRNAKRETHNSRLLILDEPTAVLTPQEFDELAAAMKKLAAAGTAIIFISHKLAEVRSVCDAVTILRRGQVVHTGPARDLSAKAMADKMVGARVDRIELPRAHAPSPTAPIRLALENITVLTDRRKTLRNVSLAARAGEIVGIAGVDGNGQTQLVHSIVGLACPARGRVLINNHDATHHSIRWRIDQLALIPEDRHREALVLPLSITQNLLLKDYRRPAFSTLGFLKLAAWRKHARTLAARFDIRCGSVEDAALSLSGGNQQKVVIARELGGDHPSDLVITVNPTRGLDVGATAFVMRQLLDARARGAAVLLVHSDLDELLAISDRVLVLYNGTLTESPWPNTTKEHIGRMMLGVDGNAKRETPNAKQDGAA